MTIEQSSRWQTNIHSPAQLTWREWRSITVEMTSFNVKSEMIERRELEMRSNSPDVFCGHKASAPQRSAPLVLTRSETSLRLLSTTDHEYLQPSSWTHTQTYTDTNTHTNTCTFRHRPGQTRTHRYRYKHRYKHRYIEASSWTNTSRHTNTQLNDTTQHNLASHSHYTTERLSAADRGSLENWVKFNCWQCVHTRQTMRMSRSPQPTHTHTQHWDEITMKQSNGITNT